MSWLDLETSLYECQADNTGNLATFRDILLTRMAVPHRWYYRKDSSSKKWESGVSTDIDTLIQLRNLDRTATNYDTSKVTLKATLQAFTPAALLKSKKKGFVEEVSRTGIMQLDFDYNAILEYDIEELKRAVFDLPFVGFCGLSCTGGGFFALALIAEPNRLSEYAEHCFVLLEKHGLKADESKGKKPENLRYVSYDCNMLIRDNPEPLLIKHFQTKPALKKIEVIKATTGTAVNSSKVVIASLNRIKNVVKGERWGTIQQVAFTMGGLGDKDLIDAIKNEIESNDEFAGEEQKYCDCADVCFAAGAEKPLVSKS